MQSPLDSPMASMGSPFGRGNRTGPRTYNGNPIMGGAILPAGTTGDHNGLPVIGVRNVNQWPPGAGVKGVDVRSGGKEFPPYQLGMNVHHQLATGTGWGYHFTNLVRGAWQVRGLSGATLDGNGWPTSVSGSQYVLVECPRFSDGQEDPYTGQHWLITNYAMDVEVITREASGSFGLIYTSGVMTVDGSSTPTEISIDIPRITGAHYTTIRITNVTNVPADKELALVHDRYLQDYKDSNGAAYLNRDIVNNYIVPLATAEDTPRKIYRSMKFTKTNAHPKIYPSAAYDADNLSYHSGFIGQFDIVENRLRFNLSGSITTNVGELITQANTGATGYVVSQSNPQLAAGSPETFDTLYLRLTSGTFNTTDELSGDETGSLGANSVPTSITSYSPAEHATPYEVLVNDAVYWDYTPWLCLQPNISDADFDAFCTNLTSAFAAGLTEIYMELGNEPWLMNGINSADWFRDEGVARWGDSTMYGTTADIGRLFKARLDMYFYDRMRTNLSAADFAKVRWTACDQPGYLAGLKAYLGRDDGNPWQVEAEAAGGTELALYNEWATMSSNPIHCWSWATYWGNWQDNIDWNDPVAVEASLRFYIDVNVSQIAASTAFIKAVVQPEKSAPLEYLSYEGGYSIYFRPHIFNDTQVMYDLYTDALDKYRTTGNTGTLIYADIGSEDGSNGAWNHGDKLVNGLSGKFRGRALIDYAQVMRDEATPATGSYNGSSVRGMVLITDPSVTTYNGQPVESINFLTGITGAGGAPTYIRQAIVLVDSHSTLIPLPEHQEGDLIGVYVGVDRGDNANATTHLGETTSDTSWTKQANAASGSDQFRTEGWLWTKVAGASEPAPTLTFDAGDPVTDDTGQAIVFILRNADQIDDIQTSSTPGFADPWADVASVNVGADNSLVLMLGTDRYPNQTFEPREVDTLNAMPITSAVNGGSGTLGNTCTSFLGHYTPGAAGQLPVFDIKFSRDQSYRPHAIVVSFSKA